MEAVIAIYSTHLSRVTVPRTTASISHTRVINGSKKRTWCCISSSLACMLQFAEAYKRPLTATAPDQRSYHIAPFPAELASRLSLGKWGAAEAGAPSPKSKCPSRGEPLGGRWSGLVCNARHEAMRRRTGRSDVQAQALCLSSPVLSGGETAGEIRLGPYPVQPKFTV
jgi:hypothetical protein